MPLPLPVSPGGVPQPEPWPCPHPHGDLRASSKALPEHSSQTAASPSAFSSYINQNPLRINTGTLSRCLNILSKTAFHQPPRLQGSSQTDIRHPSSEAALHPLPEASRAAPLPPGPSAPAGYLLQPPPARPSLWRQRGAGPCLTSAPAP